MITFAVRDGKRYLLISPGLWINICEFGLFLMYNFRGAMCNRALAIVSERLSARSGRERRIYWFSLCGVLAPALLLLSYIIASLLNPGFNHVLKTVSQLGVNGSKFPWVINSGFILFGVLMFPLACGLYIRFKSRFMARLMWFTLSLSGLCIILTGVFHAERTIVNNLPVIEGMLHVIFASLGILSLTVAILAAADIFQRYPAWRGFVWPSIAISAIVLVGAVLFSREIVPHWNGLIERVFYSLALGWVWVVAVRSFLLSPGDVDEL